MSALWPEREEINAVTFTSNLDKQVSYPGKLVWVIQWSEIGPVNKVQIFPHGDSWAGQDGEEVESVTEILENGGDRSGGRGEFRPLGG